MGNKTVTRTLSFRGRVWEDSVQRPLSANQTFSGVTRDFGLTRGGTNVPKYRQLIQAGLNATGLMTVTASNCESDAAKATVYWRKDLTGPDSKVTESAGHDGFLLNLNVPSPVTAHQGATSFDEARSKAIVLVNRRITARRRQVMGGAALGELRKTIKMVRSPAKTLVRKMESYLERATKVVKRPTRNRPSAAKALTDTYLEAMLGWQPLLLDIKDGAQALARIATKDALERQQFRVFAETEHPVSTVVSQLGPFGNRVFTGIWYRRERLTVKRLQVVMYGKFQTRLQDSSAVASLAERVIERSGFSFADWIPTAWELLPMSFVVDYFSNIGDVIEAAMNLNHGIAWISKVEISETEVFDLISPLPEMSKANMGAFFIGLDAAALTCSSSFRTVVRDVYSGTLVPSIRFTLPGKLQSLTTGLLFAAKRRS